MPDETCQERPRFAPGAVENLQDEKPAFAGERKYEERLLFTAKFRVRQHAAQSGCEALRLNRNQGGAAPKPDLCFRHPGGKEHQGQTLSNAVKPLAPSSVVNS